MNKKRLGTVSFNISYVVDLDNENMVEHAKDAVYEDVMGLTKYNEIANSIKISPNFTATEKDIPQFLLEDEDADV